MIIGGIIYITTKANDTEPVPKEQIARKKRVKVQNVQLMPFSQSLRLNANALAKESVIITAQTTDKIDNIHFKEGAYVKKGQTLVSLQQESENAAIASARATLKETQGQFERVKILARQDAISKAEYDNAAATVDIAKAALQDTLALKQERIITAPFSGIIGVREVSEGALLEPGTRIAQLDDISVIKAQLQLPERYLAYITKGQKIQVRSAAYGNETFEGIISVVENRLDPLSRQFTAIANIDNKKHRLKPGMLLNVTIHFSEKDVLAVAEETIIPLAKKHYVFVINNDTAHKKLVRIGRRFEGNVEILSGISIGDKVVRYGQLTLNEGDKVSIVSTNNLK